eukprot:2535851-Amphidinium_carterae.2
MSWYMPSSLADDYATWAAKCSRQMVLNKQTDGGLRTAEGLRRKIERMKVQVPRDPSFPLFKSLWKGVEAC